MKNQPSLPMQANTPFILQDIFAQQISRGNSPAFLLETVEWLQQRFFHLLSDKEATVLFQQTPLPKNVGFSFSRFDQGWLVLNVPAQTRCEWQTSQRSISPIKKWIAGLIAEKYGFSVKEPEVDPGLIHGGLIFRKDRESVIFANPDCLKVRMFIASNARKGWPWQKEASFRQNLLFDVALLYEPKARLSL